MLLVIYGGDKPLVKKLYTCESGSEKLLATKVTEDTWSRYSILNIKYFHRVLLIPKKRNVITTEVRVVWKCNLMYNSLGKHTQRNKKQWDNEL